jgi:hypothetical protein
LVSCKIEGPSLLGCIAFLPGDNGRTDKVYNVIIYEATWKPTNSGPLEKEKLDDWGEGYDICPVRGNAA